MSSNGCRSSSIDMSNLAIHWSLLDFRYGLKHITFRERCDKPPSKRNPHSGAVIYIAAFAWGLFPDNRTHDPREAAHNVPGISAEARSPSFSLSTYACFADRLLVRRHDSNAASCFFGVSAGPVRRGEKTGAK
ncbi:uncharacterized protein LAESUDRAFT_747498 [Laetiporus sulphureus 93-53]|uniref:Uncharacterized protein n=1 Tax=Laetiporus sulphureus 93-53 TaxID=1314785 RepID=A0A165GW28_9APHY|nr:uncharacterized protein LAESUDRAFT_747498 [Laetiporus sulphureus 93-53]KZT10905.1 hypothetical protein LAESUDRAFT_747498 [Laetiporus sulphureus 93-53]